MIQKEWYRTQNGLIYKITNIGEFWYYNPLPTYIKRKPIKESTPEEWRQAKINLYNHLKNII
jgi:hypothetical protein